MAASAERFNELLPGYSPTATPAYDGAVQAYAALLEAAASLNVGTVKP